MAVRIHVTASAAAVDDVRRVFREMLGEGFDNIPIESTGVWNFFSTSVWGVDVSKLFEGLTRLNRVGLQATTEDGSKWYLSVFQPHHDPLRFLHDFSLFRGEWNPDETVQQEAEEESDPRLAFLEPAPETKRPWSQFDIVAEDYEFLGIPISESFRDSVVGLNYGEAINRFRQYESDRLTKHLRETGIEFDQQEFLAALLWKSTSEREYDSDIGNLPRVLFTLGFRGSMEKFVLDCDHPELAIESGVEEAGGKLVKDDSFDEDTTDEDYGDDEGEGEDDEDFIDADDDDDDEEMSDEDAADIARIEAEIQQQIASRKQAVRRAAERAQDLPKVNEHAFMARTLAAAEAVEPVSIRGGAVPMTTAEIPLLNLFAKSVSVEEYPSSVIRLIFPAAFDRSDFVVKDANLTDMEVLPIEGGWLIGARSLDLIEVSAAGAWSQDHVRDYYGDALADFLLAPADGTRIDVCIADPDQPTTWMWFVGEVVDGLWQVEKTWPAMDRDTLVDALDLARNAEAYAYTLRDEAEADAVMQAVPRDAYLHNMDVRQDGLTVSCQHDGMGFIASLIFRVRFAHLLDFKPALAAVERKFRERHKLQLEMKRNAARTRRNTSAPCDKKNVVYRGTISVYWNADLASWDKHATKPLDDFKAAMTELNFQYVGDFVCKKIRDYICSHYISPDRKSYGLIMANFYGYAGYEFVSHFENDAHLTTSTSWLARSHPEIESYAQVFPQQAPVTLYHQHLWGIDRFRTHKQTIPIRLPLTLAGIATMFDQMLAKFATVESDLVSFETIDLNAE